MTELTSTQLDRLKRDVAYHEPRWPHMTMQIAEVKQLIAAVEQLQTAQQQILNQKSFIEDLESTIQELRNQPAPHNS